MLYEHKRFLIDASVPHPQEALDEFSAEGWELVAVAPRTTGAVEVWFFRRPRYSDAEIQEIVTKAKNGDEDAAIFLDKLFGNQKAWS